MKKNINILLSMINGGDYNALEICPQDEGYVAFKSIQGHLKKKFNINNFLGEITPMIKKLNIREENTYIYNLYLTYEYKNQDKIFIHLYDIEPKNNNFDIDVEIEGVPFLSIEKEDIPPSLSPLWKEIWREARKREKEKEEKGEEIHEYENEFLSEEPLSEEEYKIFINNLFGC